MPASGRRPLNKEMSSFDLLIVWVIVNNVETMKLLCFLLKVSGILVIEVKKKMLGLCGKLFFNNFELEAGEFELAGFGLLGVYASLRVG